MSLRTEEDLPYSRSTQLTPVKSVKSSGRKALDSLTYNFAMGTMNSGKRVATSLSSLPSRSDHSNTSEAGYCKNLFLMTVHNNFSIDDKYEPLITAGHNMSSYALEAENQELRAHVVKVALQLDKIIRGDIGMESSRNSVAYNTFFDRSHNPLEREFNSTYQALDETLDEYNQLANRIKQTNDPLYIASLAMRTDKVKAQIIKVEKETKRLLKSADVDEKAIIDIETGKKTPETFKEANENALKLSKAQRKLEMLQSKNDTFAREREIKEERLKELDEICENLENIEKYYFDKEVTEEPIIEYQSAAVEVREEAFQSYEKQLEETNEKYYRGQTMEDIESLLVRNAEDRAHLNRLDDIVKDQRELMNDIIARNKSKSEHEIRIIMSRTLEEWDELERNEMEKHSRKSSSKSERVLSTPPSLRSSGEDNLKSDKKNKKVVFSHVIREESEELLANDSPQILEESNKISPRSNKNRILIRKVDIRLNDKRETEEKLTQEEKPQIIKYMFAKPEAQLSQEEKVEIEYFLQNNEEMMETSQESKYEPNRNLLLDLDGVIHEDETEDNNSAKVEEKLSIKPDDSLAVEILESTENVELVEKAVSPREAGSAKVEAQVVEKAEELEVVELDQDLKVEELNAEEVVQEKKEETKIVPQEVQEIIENLIKAAEDQLIETLEKVTEPETVEELPAEISTKPVFFRRSSKSKVPNLGKVILNQNTESNDESGAVTSKTNEEVAKIQSEPITAEIKEQVLALSVQFEGVAAAEACAEAQTAERSVGKTHEENTSQSICTQGEVQAEDCPVDKTSENVLEEEQKPTEELVLPECAVPTQRAQVIMRDASVGTIDLEDEDEYLENDFMSNRESQISSQEGINTVNETVFSEARTIYMATGFGSTGRVNKLRMGSTQDLMGTVTSGISTAEEREEQERRRLQKQRDQIKTNLLESNRTMRSSNRGTFGPRPHLVSRGIGGADEVNTVYEAPEDSWTESSAWEYSEREGSVTDGSIMGSILVKPTKVSIAIGTDGYFDPDQSLGGEQEAEDENVLNKKRLVVKKRLMGKGIGSLFSGVDV